MALRVSTPSQSVADQNLSNPAAQSEHHPHHPRNRARAPRIGSLPKHAAFDEEDDPVVKGPAADSPGLGRKGVISGHPQDGGLGSRSNDKQNTTSAMSHAQDSTMASNGQAKTDSNQSGSGGSVQPASKLEIAKEVFQNTKNAMINSFAQVIESTKDLSVSDEKQRSPTKEPYSSSAAVKSDEPVFTRRGTSLKSEAKQGRPRFTTSTSLASTTSSEDSLIAFSRESQVPVPAKCSSQLRKLIHSHSLTQPQVPTSSPPPEASGPRGTVTTRPILPSLPYSPYGSPTSSPRVKRKPLRETKRVNSITESSGEYVQLNQYKLEGAIGQGSYGIVKLAYNKEDDSHYAMKILSKKKLKRKAGIFGRGIPNRKVPGGGERKMTEDPLQKVYREIAIMKKLDHPNVVKLIEVLDDPEDDNLYMVFELLQGGEILEVPTNNPMDEKQAWLAFRDVILGLEYLHYQKIIHRDIKPSNLLRTVSGLVKIADLGVSNEFHGHDAFLTNTAGTPAFTPPESLAHKPGDDPYSGRAADIWSLGVTLFALVFGQVPFHDENILALYNKIRTQNPVFPRKEEGSVKFDISPELQDLIGKMLVKDPASRITLAEIKVHEWVTGFGLYPLASEEENCVLVEVTDIDIDSCVRSVPKLDTLILVKTMIKNHSFTNPFITIKHRLQSDGRSNSAPEVAPFESDRKVVEPNLPVLSEERHPE